MLYAVVAQLYGCYNFYVGLQIKDWGGGGTQLHFTQTDEWIIKLFAFFPLLNHSKPIWFTNTKEVQIKSSNLHLVSKTNFEIKDCIRLLAIDGGNSN